MIKNILFDFDGVILDSIKLKGDGFVELFKEYDKQYQDAIFKHHMENRGVSRFVKVRYFFEELVKEDVSQEKVDQYLEKYSQIMTKMLSKKENLIMDTLQYIENNYKRYNLHVVSAAEHNELNQLCNDLDLKKYFITINGSPTLKSQLVENIFLEFGYNKDETCLIGDSINDLKAANDNNIEFYGYNNLDLKEIAKNYIDSFDNVEI